VIIEEAVVETLAEHWHNYQTYLNGSSVKGGTLRGLVRDSILAVAEFHTGKNLLFIIYIIY
jgi:hypothetical protein